MHRFALLILALSTLLLISACSDIERSAGMAFGNANSVIRSGSGVMWGGEAKATPTPVGNDRHY